MCVIIHKYRITTENFTAILKGRSGFIRWVFGHTTNSIAFYSVRHEFSEVHWPVDSPFSMHRQQFRRLTIQNELPHKYYNERKKSILQIRACLLDEYDTIVKGLNVPLKATLHYEHETDREDLDQRMLTSPDKKIAIDIFGITILRFRIEDISRNHLNRRFQIKLAPDTSTHPEYADINAVLTTPIHVMSKNPTDRIPKTAHRAQKRKDVPICEDDSDDESEFGYKLPRTYGTISWIAKLNLTCNDPANDLAVAVDDSHLRSLDHSIAPTAPTLESMPDISPLPNFKTNKFTGQAFEDYMTGYNSAMREIKKLKWVKIGEDEKGEPLYRMTNPNDKITAMLEK